MSYRRVAVLLLACLLAAGGCSYRAPTVSLQDVSITGASDEAVALAFVMELANPNAMPLELDQFSYTLSIDGTQVYRGRRATDATLSATDTRHMTIPAVIPYHAVGWTAGAIPPEVQFELAGSLQYKAPNQITQILFDTGVARPKVGFAGGGTVQFK